RVSGGRLRDQGERGPAGAMDLEADGARETRPALGKRGAHLALQRGVAGLPEQLSGLHPPPLDVAVAEAHRGEAAAVRAHLVHPAALLALLGPAAVEDHAVAGPQRRLQPQAGRVGLDVLHGAEENAALRAEARVDQRAVVDAAEPAREEAARETHFQLVLC